MLNLLNTYEKAIRVIDSCQNEIHIKAAINYCNNFKTQFTRMGGDEVLINIYYNDLMNQISDKIYETNPN